MLTEQISSTQSHILSHIWDATCCLAYIAALLSKGRGQLIEVSTAQGTNTHTNCNFFTRINMTVCINNDENRGKNSTNFYCWQNRVPYFQSSKA